MFMPQNFPLRTAFAASHRFLSCYVFIVICFYARIAGWNLSSPFPSTHSASFAELKKKEKTTFFLFCDLEVSTTKIYQRKAKEQRKSGL